MRLIVGLALCAVGFSVQASTQCGEGALPKPLPVNPTLLSPIADGFSVMNPQLASQRGVLAPAFDESQSVDNVLLRMRVEECQKVAVAALPAAAAASPNPSDYVKLTEHDNTPYRFNMTQNGKRMTADDFDAWLQANGYSAGRRADPNAAPAAAAQPAGAAAATDQ